MKIQIQSGTSSRSYVSRRGAAFVSVGRRSDSDILLDDQGVSDVHLKFEHFVGRWSFTDQMSDTGTKHNGETKYSGELEAGDKLQVGGTILTVISLDEEIAPAERLRSDNSWKEEIRHTTARTKDEYRRVAEHDHSNDSREYSTAKDAASSYAVKPESPSRTPQRTDTKPAAGAKNGARLFRALMVVVVVVGVIAYLVYLESSEEGADPKPNQTAESIPKESVAPKSESRMPRELEYDIRKQLDALLNKEDTRPPVEKLAEHKKLLAQAEEYASHGLDYSFERVYTALRIELYGEMQDRYSKVNGDTYDLEKSNKFKDALFRVHNLNTYLNQADLHKELAEMGEMQKWVDRKLPALVDGNGWYIGDCFTRIDEAMQRDDYALGVQVLQECRDNAELEDALKQKLDAEFTAVNKLALQQENGELQAPSAPFDRRKDKLPPAEVSDLLPGGDAMPYGTLNKLKKRLEEAWKAGETANADCTFYGRSAKLQPKGEDWRMVLKVTHTCASGEAIEYYVRHAQHNLPEATTISLYETISPTRDELLAMLMSCFNQGLKEDARRIACKLWKTDESVKPDLDQLLATKLGIEIPEGGFKEVDGKLE